MSSNAYLSSYTPATHRLTGPHFEGKTHVPLLWLAMFARHHHVSRLPFQFDWMKEPKVAESCLTAAASDASALFKRRLPALRRFCGPAHEGLLERFASVVRDQLTPAVLVRLDALVWMDVPGRFDAQLDKALDAIAGLDLDDPELRAIIALGPDWQTEPFADVRLCGFWPD